MVRLPYSQLVQVKTWADHCLIDAILQNRDRLDARERTIMIQILDHIHVVDRIFQHHLIGTPHTYGAARSEIVPDFDTLADGIRTTDLWYGVYVDGLEAKDFDQVVDFTFTSGKPARMTRAQIILHVCLHGTYHRGNAGAVLQLKGLTPGRDGITDFLELAA